MKSIRTLGTLAVTAAAAMGMATSANAADPTGDYANFKYCPYTNTTVTTCVYSDTNGGAIKLGNSNVPIPSSKHLILQGGIAVGQTTTTPWYNAVGGPTLSPTSLDVPGGLVSMVSSNWFFGPLLDAFNSAISSFNGVTATAELVGPVKFSLGNILNSSGTGVELPLRIKLSNPFLGNDCYIGSAGTPVTFKLTTGTTAPPAGVTPKTGAPGTLSFINTVVLLNGTSLVDNTFAVPAATGCGSTFIDRPLVTFAVNAKVGLPAAAGVNSATLNGGSKIAARTEVAASAGL